MTDEGLVIKTNTHVGKDITFNNLAGLRSGRDCIKIVISESDLAGLPEIIRIIREHNKLIDIYLSPQWGSVDFDRIVEFIISNRLNVRLSLQIHKVIWGNKRGV